MRQLMLCGMVVLAALMLLNTSGAQTNGKDEFPRTRDLTPQTDLMHGQSVFVFTKYRLKKTRPATAKPNPQPPPHPRNGTRKPPAAPPVEVTWKRLGVTVWRWTQGADAAEPVRVSADTKFNVGEKVRLQFESAEAGYLYVFDREVYTDGTYGEPLLVFPTMMSHMGMNKVEPGRVIDIPSDSDNVKFFTLKSSDQRWKGEALTVIVSPEPLNNIQIPGSPTHIPGAIFQSLLAVDMWPVGEYDLDGANGSKLTVQEKAAAVGTRELTLTDAYPQTMFKAQLPQQASLFAKIDLIAK